MWNNSISGPNPEGIPYGYAIYSNGHTHSVPSKKPDPPPKKRDARETMSKMMSVIKEMTTGEERR